MLDVVFSWNTQVLQLLNDFVSQSPGVQQIVFFMADMPIFFLPVFLLGTWLFLVFHGNDFQKKDQLTFIVVSCIFALCVNLLIQQFVHMDRPEQAINATSFLIPHIPDASFPSDHSAVVSAFVFGLWFAGYKKTFFLFTPFAIIMLVSRVAGGVHWPVDIIAGIIIGWIASLVIFSLQYSFILQKIAFFFRRIALFFRL